MAHSVWTHLSLTRQRACQQPPEELHHEKHCLDHPETVVAQQRASQHLSQDLHPVLLLLVNGKIILKEQLLLEVLALANFFR